MAVKDKLGGETDYKNIAIFINATQATEFMYYTY